MVGFLPCVLYALIIVTTEMPHRSILRAKRERKRRNFENPTVADVSNGNMHLVALSILAGHSSQLTNVGTLCFLLPIQRRQQPAFTLHRSHIRKMYSVVHGSNAAKCWPMPTSVRSGVTAVRQPAPRDNEGRRATMASIGVFVQLVTQRLVPESQFILLRLSSAATEASLLLLLAAVPTPLLLTTATDRANYAMLEGVYAQHTSHAPVAPVVSINQPFASTRAGGHHSAVHLGLIVALVGVQHLGASV